MKRRDFLKVLGSVFGASVFPVALSDTAVPEIPDVVFGMPLDRAFVLNSISIGGAVTDFGGSIMFPKGCRPQISFKHNHVLIGADDTTFAAIRFDPAPSIEMDVQWYEIDEDILQIAPIMKYQRFPVSV